MEGLTIPFYAVFALWMLGVGIYYLWIGVKGLRSGSPLLFPGRRIVWMVAPLAILPQLFSGVSTITSQSPLLSQNYFPFIAVAFWIFWAILMWYQMNGYLALGASAETLRNALRGTLEQLNLPFQESLSQIHLNSLNADLQVSVAAWAGSAQIRVKQVQQRSSVLAAIIPSLRTQLALQSSPLVKRALYLYTAIGLLICVAGIGFIVFMVGLALTERVPAAAQNCTPGTNRIAFLSLRDDKVGGDLYLMNANGSCRIRLTQNTGGVYPPAWFADGKRLLVNFYNDGMYIVNTDGSKRTPFPSLGMQKVYDYAFSPDGKHLAFSAGVASSEPQSNVDIFVTSADGIGSATDLTSSNTGLKQDYTPVWSPDGKRIAFIRGMVNSDHDIYLMNADGSNQQLLKINFGDKPTTVLTRHITNGSTLIWSPDGTQLVFESARDGNAEIYNINVADALKDTGSDLTNLTNSPADDGSPSWSPDGKHIAFASDRDGTSHIYIMDSDGNNVVQVTHSEDFSPLWVNSTQP